ncbi:hypothetical protein OIDMADRAFT_124358 [Oidiodendron maius Zn]|uniref:Amino acid transporter transmembrane domain-containing protein n=1 Tax=Oidiodendron maius (strain Zn) TaxID=913774 RepID=A0A0C3GWV4_OIDMZ|nr:hypothetical protein OIDMADRAFT_124358 [Oidiodendron maius Zn]
MLLGQPNSPDLLGIENTDPADIHYKTCKWWQTGILMVAETISLGILSLPSVLSKVGLIPGIILIFGMGLFATYSGYVIYQFKLEYPWVRSMADAGEVMFKPWGDKAKQVGRELGGAAQTIFLVFSMASHILTWTICFDILTDHTVCNVVWGIVALIVFWVFDLPRTLRNMSYFSIASFLSIFIAVMVTMVALGVKGPGQGMKLYSLWPKEGLTFQEAFLSVSNIMFAYAGHVAFFGFLDEMENPRDFPKSLAFLQISDISMYCVTAIVVYRYAGTDVTSPAFGSAGISIAKVAYGIAIPTASLIIITTGSVIYGHVSSTYIYIRAFPKYHSKNTWKAWGLWASITICLWIIAWVIAQSIPEFNDLLALISSLFASWFSYGVSGLFWLFLNWHQWTKNMSKMLLAVVNITLVTVGGTICFLGIYASGYAINTHQGQGGSWSCSSSSSI